MGGVRVEVLGPLRLVVEDRAVTVPGQKRRALLALLALGEGRTVPIDHLVDALWPDATLESARAALHSHVSRLRAHLGAMATCLQTRADGYRLDLGTEGLDVTRARATLTAAMATTARGDTAGAFAMLAEAHALWRGPALADLTDVAPIATAVAGHAHLRRDVTDALIASAVASGCPDRVAALAAESVADEPLREPAVLLLMRVLAAVGHAPEALRVGREYRDRLADETGLDPSPALDTLVREIAAGSRPRRATTGQALAGSDRAPRLYGRDAELEELPVRLGEQRLVTLVGPGGVGKTRLALEVAGGQPGATAVRLAPVSHAGGIPHALAAALGLSVGQGDVLAACLAVLADRAELLIIDNCEHLLDAARETVAVILQACPRLSVLATSREPLGLTAEYVHRLAPLALPVAEQDPGRAPSVAVFVDRAQRVRPGLDLGPEQLRRIGGIVARLDGMPLAIELAAGRLSTFSVADLGERLDRALDLLGGRPSGEARHQTLRETIDWSYRLLDNDEQRLFRNMSIFADGLDLATAEHLARRLCPGGDPGRLLARLVDASMVVAELGEGTRYRMLETLRAFAHDRLAAAGEQEAAAEHLLRWALETTAWIGTTLLSEREADADAVLRREQGNLRAAWDLARTHERAQIISALNEAVTYRDLVELRDWALDLAADPALPGHPREAMVLATAAEAAYHRGDHDRAEALARAGLERADGQEAGAWHSRVVLSVVALARGDYAQAVAQSLALTRMPQPPREAYGGAALATAYAGDTDAARALNEQGLATAASPAMRAWGAYVAGEIENCAGREQEAERHYRTAIAEAGASGASFLVGVATVGLHSVRARSGRIEDALVGYREVIDYFDRTGNWTHQWTTLRNLADLLRRLGDDEPATTLDAAADRAPDAPPTTRRPTTLVGAVPGRTAVLVLAREAIDRHLRNVRPT